MTNLQEQKKLTVFANIKNKRQKLVFIYTFYVIQCNYWLTVPIFDIDQKLKLKYWLPFNIETNYNIMHYFG